MTSVADLWKTLLHEGPDDLGFVARRLNEVSACDVFLALQRPGNTRALLIEVANSTVPARIRLPEATGFGTGVIAINPGQNGRSRLVLHARDGDPHFLFGTLVEDVVRHLADAHDPAAAIRVLDQRLHRWQRFFAGGGAQGLSPKQQQGLWAELWFLREHLIRKDSSAAALAGWNGPDAGNHDFEYHAFSIEVKSSRAGPSIDVSITNVMQLQQVAGKALLLFVLLLDSVNETGESLADIVDSLRESLRHDARATALLEDRLLDAGYTDALRNSYPVLRFAVREEHVFDVRSGFPRIVESDLSPGVGAVRYTVSLAACEPYRVAMASFRDSLGEIFHDG